MWFISQVDFSSTKATWQLISFVTIDIVSLSWIRLWSMWSVWLVFCDWGFPSFCPLMEKDKRLMEASCWERLTVGRTGSCSDGQGNAQYIFNPIFCLMGGAVFPLCCFIWDQTMVEVMKIMATSFKSSHVCTATLSAPDPAAGHCRPMPPPETPGHSRASLGQSQINYH